MSKSEPSSKEKHDAPGEPVVDCPPVDESWRGFGGLEGHEGPEGELCRHGEEDEHNEEG